MALTDLLTRNDHVIAAGGLFAVKGGYYQATLAAGVTLDNTYPTLIGLDPGGSTRIVLLDAESLANQGLFRIIYNRADAAENLTVKDAAAATIGTVSQNEIGVFYMDSVAAGWVLVALIDAVSLS